MRFRNRRVERLGPRTIALGIGRAERRGGRPACARWRRRGPMKSQGSSVRGEPVAGVSVRWARTCSRRGAEVESVRGGMRLSAVGAERCRRVGVMAACPASTSSVQAAPLPGHGRFQDHVADDERVEAVVGAPVGEFGPAFGLLQEDRAVVGDVADGLRGGEPDGDGGCGGDQREDAAAAVEHAEQRDGCGGERHAGAVEARQIDVWAQLHRKVRDPDDEFEALAHQPEEGIGEAEAARRWRRAPRRAWSRA